MSAEQSSAKPKVRHKRFTYKTAVEWLGDRAGKLQGEDKPEFRVASPPEFKGESGVWTPEDLFVAAVEVCLLTTFSAFTQRRKLAIRSYVSRSEGHLEFVEDGYRFTKIFVRPTIVIEREEDREAVQKTLESAHHKCLISNSILAEVVLEPEISAAE